MCRDVYNMAAEENFAAILFYRIKILWRKVIINEQTEYK